MLGLTERVIYLNTIEKKTNQQIAEILQRENHDVSRESVRLVTKSAKELAFELMKYKEEAKVIADTVRNTPDADLVEVMTDQIAGAMYQASKTFDPSDFENSTEFVNAVAKLTTSKTQLVKLRLSFRDGFEAAKTSIQTELKKELENYPDILEKIEQIVSKMKSEK